MWVPGLMGLTYNIHADTAVTPARDYADQAGVPIQEHAQKLIMARSIKTEALTANRTACVYHTHFKTSNGGELVDFSELMR